MNYSSGSKSGSGSGSGSLLINQRLEEILKNKKSWSLKTAKIDNYFNYIFCTFKKVKINNVSGKYDKCLCRSQSRNPDLGLLRAGAELEQHCSKYFSLDTTVPLNSCSSTNMYINELQT